MSIISTISKKIFEKLIKSSNSWTEVMIYFRDKYGYKNLKNNKTAKKRCDKEKISYSHFNGGKIKVELSKTKKPYSSHNLKKRLFKEGILEEKCYKCGLGKIWQGSPITLQLEHIDGDHYNNEIKNLTILCPNCHSQTDTWCGKTVNPLLYMCVDCKKEVKKGSGRCRSCAMKERHRLKKLSEEDSSCEAETEEELDAEETNIDKTDPNNKCTDCNEIIHRSSKRCRSCSSKHNTPRKVPDRPTLEQLQADLNELSYVKVGIKYGVSDNAIRKWIKQYSKKET